MHAADVSSAISVAASDLNTKFERNGSGDEEVVYSWSNTGACIDLFAPGVDIYAACGGASAPLASDHKDQKGCQMPAVLPAKPLAALSKTALQGVGANIGVVCIS